MAPEVLREAWADLPAPKDDGSMTEPLPPSTYKANSQPADIYSLGVILKELTCLTEPYDEYHDSPFGENNQPKCQKRPAWI